MAALPSSSALSPTNAAPPPPTTTGDVNRTTSGHAQEATITDLHRAVLMYGDEVYLRATSPYAIDSLLQGGAAATLRTTHTDHVIAAATGKTLSSSSAMQHQQKQQQTKEKASTTTPAGASTFAAASSMPSASKTASSMPSASKTELAAAAASTKHQSPSRASRAASSIPLNVGTYVKHDVLVLCNELDFDDRSCDATQRPERFTIHRTDVRITRKHVEYGDAIILADEKGCVLNNAMKQTRMWTNGYITLRPRNVPGELWVVCLPASEGEIRGDQAAAGSASPDGDMWGRGRSSHSKEKKGQSGTTADDADANATNNMDSIHGRDVQLGMPIRYGDPLVLCSRPGGAQGLLSGQAATGAADETKVAVAEFMRINIWRKPSSLCGGYLMSNHSGSGKETTFSFVADERRQSILAALARRKKRAKKRRLMCSADPPPARPVVSDDAQVAPTEAAYLKNEEQRTGAVSVGSTGVAAPVSVHQTTAASADSSRKVGEGDYKNNHTSKEIMSSGGSQAADVDRAVHRSHDSACRVDRVATSLPGASSFEAQQAGSGTLAQPEKAAAARTDEGEVAKDLSLSVATPEKNGGGEQVQVVRGQRGAQPCEPEAAAGASAAVALEEGPKTSGVCLSSSSMCDAASVISAASAAGTGNDVLARASGMGERALAEEGSHSSEQAQEHACGTPAGSVQEQPVTLERTAETTPSPILLTSTTPLTSTAAVVDSAVVPSSSDGASSSVIVPPMRSRSDGSCDLGLRFGDFIWLYAKSPYLSDAGISSPYTYVGVYEKHQLACLGSSTQRLFHAARFRLTRPRQATPSDEIHYGDCVILVDQNEQTWNMNTGSLYTSGYVAVQPRVLARGPSIADYGGEIHVRIHSLRERHAKLGWPVSFGDSGIVLECEVPSRLWGSVTRRITNFRRETSGIDGGYLCCDGSGKDVTFEIRGANAVLERYGGLMVDGQLRRQGAWSSAAGALPGSSSRTIYYASDSGHERDYGTNGSSGKHAEDGSASSICASSRARLFSTWASTMERVVPFVEESSWIWKSDVGRIIGLLVALQLLFMLLSRMLGPILGFSICGVVCTFLIMRLNSVYEVYVRRLVASAVGGAVPSADVSAGAANDSRNLAGDGAVKRSDGGGVGIDISAADEPLKVVGVVNSGDEPPQRFITAEKGNYESARKRWHATRQWREEEGINTMLSEPLPFFDTIKRHTVQYYHGKDRAGRVVYIDVLRATNLKALKQASIGVTEIIRYYTFITEYLWRVLDPNDNGQCCSIIDANGIGVSDFAGDVVDVAKKFSAVTKNHYPERCGQIFVVNATWSFNMVWKIVRGFMDPETRRKTHVSSVGNYRKLLQAISSENLPVEYGGSCSCTRCVGGGGGQGGLQTGGLVVGCDKFHTACAVNSKEEVQLRAFVRGVNSKRLPEESEISAASVEK